MSDPTAPAPERTACCGDHCTATATHGPGAFPVACWQHAGDWPEIPAPPPSEAPPSCPTGYTCEGCGAKHAPEEIGATGGQCGACGRVMGGPPSDPSPPESAPPVAKPVALGPIVIGTIPAVPEIRTREEFEALMERGQLPPEAPAPSEPARPVPLSTADLDGLERSLDAGRTWEPDEATARWVLGVLRRASEPAAPGGEVACDYCCGVGAGAPAGHRVPGAAGAGDREGGAGEPGAAGRGGDGGTRPVGGGRGLEADRSRGARVRAVDGGGPGGAAC